MSWGRWPDGAADFYPLAARTPGTNNSAIWIGDIVINELMYDPISGNDDDQYIELYQQGIQHRQPGQLAIHCRHYLHLPSQRQPRARTATLWLPGTRPICSRNTRT